jgi:hypothetical protein
MPRAVSNNAAQTREPTPAQNPASKVKQVKAAWLKSRINWLAIFIPLSFAIAYIPAFHNANATG